LLSAATLAFAQHTPIGPRAIPNGVTWGELALLPAFCADAQGILYGDQYGNPSPRAAHWVALMGQSFWAIHHYCYALAAVRRADEAGIPDRQRRFIYGRAIQDYLYALNNSAPDMVLAPEILVHLGDAYLKVGQVSDADAAFAKARRIKPDYWPAYSRWVDVMIKLKLNKGAYALARQGLAHAPDSEILRRQFVSLGGDPASVAAAAPAASAASAATAAASAPEPAASAASAGS
jgi:tetratricopeptide (TPR) repeat protein